MIFKKLPVKIEDIKNILSIPFKNMDHNKSVIKSLLLTKYTSNYDENVELLRINIEDGRYGKYKEYYKYLEEIRTHIDNYDIFKIVNEIEDDYSIAFYNDTYGKYVFKTRTTNEYETISLHARLWSACGSELTDMKELIAKSFYQHIVDNTTIEEAMFKNIDKTKLLEVEQIHCEGLIAPWNTLINE
jgi:hypothetical protein